VDDESETEEDLMRLRRNRKAQRGLGALRIEISEREILRDLLYPAPVDGIDWRPAGRAADQRRA
jgi:hypothetical protein